MKDMVIGCFNNYTYSDIEPWVKSLLESGFDGVPVVICYGIDKATTKRLTDEGFVVVEKDIFTTQNPDFNIVVQRFFDVPEYLRSLPQDKKPRVVIVTDVKDVIFQDDPSIWITAHLSESDIVFASSEDLTYSQEPWSSHNMKTSFGEEQYEKMKDRTIACAGVLAGTPDELSRVMMDVWLMCQDKPNHVSGGGGPDQAAYNIVLSIPLQYNSMLVSQKDDCWAAQLGTSKPAVVAGSGDIGYLYVNQKITMPEGISNPTMINGYIVNENKVPYFIVHQWDRVPEFRETILKKFSKKKADIKLGTTDGVTVWIS